MNRIQLSPLAKSKLSGHTNYKSASAEVQQNRSTKPTCFDSSLTSTDLLDYSLVIPEHYESGYSYPLIVWLHGPGHQHRQILRVMPGMNARNYGAVSVGSDSQEECWEQESSCIERTAEKVQVAIDHAKLRLNIDSQQVFIAGMGTGGSMAFRLAFSFPHWFAGVASLNGAVPGNACPLGNWSRCKSVPVFWAHARKSNSFSEPDLCDQLRLLHIGGFSVTLRQYPCDDRLNKKVYSDLNNWVMDTISDQPDVDSIIK